MVSYNFLYESIVAVRPQYGFHDLYASRNNFYKLVLACVIKVICFVVLAGGLAIYYMVKKAPIGFER